MGEMVGSSTVKSESMGELGGHLETTLVAITKYCTLLSLVCGEIEKKT